MPCYSNINFSQQIVPILLWHNTLCLCSAWSLDIGISTRLIVLVLNYHCVMLHNQLVQASDKKKKKKEKDKHGSRKDKKGKRKSHGKAAVVDGDDDEVDGEADEDKKKKKRHHHKKATDKGSDH